MSITPPAPENPLGQPSGAQTPPPPPAETRVTAPTAQGHYASWLQRLGAVIVDSLIVAIPVYVILGILIAGGAADEDVVNEGGFDPLWSLVSLVVSYSYYGLTMGRKGERNGQTFGKQVLGIRVVREDGVQMGFWWAIGRELVKGIFGAITLGLTYLWPLWDKKNQGLHDKVMHDLVVRAQ